MTSMNPVPSVPTGEAERMRALLKFDLLETGQDPDFDNLARLASEICGTPISLVSLVDSDRQWFKSNIGLGGVTETDRCDAFCAYNILEPDDILVVPDARLDERFVNNPLVTGYPNIVFYAGAPLVTREGHALGSLCVIDREPREITENQKNALASLSRQVVKLMELRLALKTSQAQREALRVSNENLRDFGHILAHDLKAPLRNIGGFAEIVVEDYGDHLPPDGRQCLETIQALAAEARQMVKGVLNISQAVNSYSEKAVSIDIADLVDRITTRLGVPEECTVDVVGPLAGLVAPPVLVEHILHNLLDNAVRYAAPDCPVVTVGCSETSEHYLLWVKDNGVGVRPEDKEKIFTLYYTEPTEEKVSTGHGVGLNIVQQLTKMLGGEVSLGDEEDSGATFKVTIPKSRG